ncbi:MAG: hypothetical protein RQ757_03135 [Pseudomonadales bacterium]|nr:hypothetical protein [Pseudomonadales bacterium]
MKFLVIVLCLLLNHHWRKERWLPGDRWYLIFQQWLQSRLDNFAWYKNLSVRQGQRLLCALLLLLPVTLLWVLLWLLQGQLLGLVTLALHVGVLLLLLERNNMVELSRDYLQYWREAQYETAYKLLETRAPEYMQGDFEDSTQVHQHYCTIMLGSYFDKVFVLLFWYLLLGPAAALLCALVRLYLNAGANSRVSGSWQDENDASGLMSGLLFIIEYLPARILVLTFALVANFSGPFKLLRAHVLDTLPGFELVRRSAFAAISESGIRTEDDVDLEMQVSRQVEPTALAAVREVEDLQVLMLRSQIIWVCALALVIVLGIGANF